MEEPSVLDYVKAKLAFWRKSDLHFPAPAADFTAEGGAPLPGANPADPQPEVQTASSPAVVSPRVGIGLIEAFNRMPWMALLALFLGLAGQLFIEPPGRNWQLALAMYAFSAICLVVAFRQGQFAGFETLLGLSEPEAAAAGSHKDISGGADLLIPWTVSGVGLTLGGMIALVGASKWENGLLPAWGQAGLIAAAGVLGLCGLGITTWGLLTLRAPDTKTAGQKFSLGATPTLWTAAVVLLILAAFLSFKDNLFTSVNLFLWLVLILVCGLAVAAPAYRQIWQRVRSHSLLPLVIRVDVFALLLLVVVGITAYFRLTNLDGLPANMFSDHAEKLYDVQDVLAGKYATFFERNTGRELFQFYWTALMALVFKTGISFMSLKLGTMLAGLITLVFIYRLGEEVGGKWVGLYALFFAAIGYWPNIISRIGLRFPLYPFCVAPVLFYLLRGLRLARRSDFVWAGLWLGIGLHGYTASRLVPVLVLIAFGLYLAHKQSLRNRRAALVWLAGLALVCFAVFLPLFHYSLDNPQMVLYRSLTRMGSTEQPLPGPAVVIFFSNLWRALVMFFWDNGDVWVHSIPGRPALAALDAALFFGGVVLLAARYFKRFHWRDLFLLVSIPVLLLPSVLSLAFPNENPNLNRTAGVYVVVFVILGIGLDALLRAIQSRLGGKSGAAWAAALGLLLATISLSANYKLFFVEYQAEYNAGAWNTREMGEVMRGFGQVVGTGDTSWVVGYPYWVDTRLVAINAGYPNRNPETFADRIEQTFVDPRPKLYLLNTADVATLDLLRIQFPEGRFWLHKSPLEGKDFVVFTVPAAADTMP